VVVVDGIIETRTTAGASLRTRRYQTGRGLPDRGSRTAGRSRCRRPGRCP